jgi:hypothetical protein
MTWFRPLAALPIAALCAGIVTAQADSLPPPNIPPSNVLEDTKAHEQRQTAERTEDVEILRRILNHSLGLPIHHAASLAPMLMNGMSPGVANLFVPNNGGGWSGPSFPQPALNNQFLYSAAQTTSVGPFDGVSLPGYGVVYTLRIPDKISLVLDPPAKSVGLAETCRKCHGTEPVSRDALEPAGDKAQPLTEWDRTRQELRGTKQTANQPPAAPRLTRQQICQPGNMTDRIVEKLWQNMQHVRHLAPTDRVTVAITFDGLTGSSKDRQTLNPPTDWQDRLAPTEKKAIPDQLGFYPEESKQLTLGDLHLKQGKPKEAVAAYERALARFRHGPDGRFAAPSGFTAAQRGEMAAELQKGVRSAYRHLAQAWLAAGDVEKGQAALNMAQKYTVRLVSANDRDKRVSVPAKLLISVTRADADKAGNNLLNFRKAVKVEAVGFPPADPAKK